MEAAGLPVDGIFQLAPEWTREDAQILREAMIYFGVAQWDPIIASGCLPNKTKVQLCAQAQQLFGQVSLGPFLGVHMDANMIFQQNIANTTAKRHNGLIISEPHVVTPDIIEYNRAKYTVADFEKHVVINRSGPDSRLALAKARLKFLKDRVSSYERTLRQIENKHPASGSDLAVEGAGASGAADPPKRKRGRPRKNPDAPASATSTKPPATKKSAAKGAVSAADWSAVRAAASTDPELYAELEYMREREYDRQETTLIDDDDDFEPRRKKAKRKSTGKVGRPPKESKLAGSQ